MMTPEIGMTTQEIGEVLRKSQAYLDFLAQPDIRRMIDAMAPYHIFDMSVVHSEVRDCYQEAIAALGGLAARLASFEEAVNEHPELQKALAGYVEEREQSQSTMPEGHSID